MTDDTGSGNAGDVDGGCTDAQDRGRPFIDDVFEALADWRRREVCQFFVETGAETATVDDLAMLVAGCRPASLDGSPSPSHEDLVAQLTETHLPRLDEAGVVDFDERSGAVRYRGQPTVEKWLEHVAAVDRRG